MTNRYDWAHGNNVLLAVVTHGDGPWQGENLDEGSTALMFHYGDALMIEGKHDDLLALIERMRLVVQEHKDAHTIPTFATMAEADAWLERRTQATAAAAAAAKGGWEKTHGFTEDTHLAGYCICGLPPENAIHWG